MFRAKSKKKGKSTDESNAKRSAAADPTTPPRTITTTTAPGTTLPSLDIPPPRDDDTIPRSGNPAKTSSKSTKSSASKLGGLERELSLREQLEQTKEALAQEKAGKRKLFHSLVKLANELKRTRTEAKPVLDRQAYAERNWHEGGMWRAPAILPTIQATASSLAMITERESATNETGAPAAVPTKKKRTSMMREAISLSDLFFNLVVVTAFTRVGVALSEQGYVDTSSLLYFAMFWNVWNKEAQYSTRFDTTDLSAQVVTLVTCFAVLFASLSVQVPLDSVEATRIMAMAAFVAILHACLHIRVAVANNFDQGENPLAAHVMHYAIFNIVMTVLEATVWLVGILVFPSGWEYRWAIFLAGVVLGLRVPRAFLANDFHAACSKRGVLFILLLGFLLQSVVVVASEFFDYQTPTLAHYAFVGAACLMFFCIKLLYVDDSDTLTEDHALLVNRWAAFFFHLGNFCLLLSTTVMGSGLNLLTHDYMSATAALPGPAKTLVCGGFSAVLLSTFFIKSLHLKRVPTDPRNRALFVGAYVIQGAILLLVVAITAAMSLGFASSVGFLQYLMQTDIQLLFALSGAALFVVMMSWLDEGVELSLYESATDSREFRIHPFGFWWCLQPEISAEEMAAQDEAAETADSVRGLSALSPLLGSSAADLAASGSYQSLRSEDVGKLV